MKRKSGVTKRTWNKNATKFATEYSAAWKDLKAFVDSNCAKKSPIDRETFLDKMCEVVDRYVDLNCDILLWCHKNGVDPRDFVCDVKNTSFAM